MITQNSSLKIQQIYQKLPSSSQALIETLDNYNYNYLTNNFRYQIIPILKNLYPEDKEIQSMYRYSLDEDVFDDIFIRISELTYIDWQKVLEMKKEKRKQFKIYLIPFYLISLIFGRKNLLNLLYFLKNLPKINDNSNEAIEDYNFLIDLATLKHFCIIK